MSNLYIMYNFLAEIQGTGSRSEAAVSLTRSSAVAKRPRVARPTCR